MSQPKNLRADWSCSPIRSSFRLAICTKIYQSGDETQTIENAFERAGNKAEGIGPSLQATEADLEAKHARIAEMETEMAAISGNPALLNSRIPVHNDLVTEYNAELANYLEESGNSPGLC